MRTERTPALASFVAISLRAASLWLHAQWNCTPTAGRSSAVFDPGTARAEPAAPTRRAAMRAMRQGIARGAYALWRRIRPERPRGGYGAAVDDRCLAAPDGPDPDKGRA